MYREAANTGGEEDGLSKQGKEGGGGFHFLKEGKQPFSTWVGSPKTSTVYGRRLT